MINYLEILSPAKINLTLEILELRPDGYHNIDSLVQTINLYDRMTIRRCDSDCIALKCNNKDVPTGQNNLIIRACELLFQESGVSAGLDIYLEKRIPMQAGLGGGSSNAAMALVGLNQLLDLGLTRDRLASIGSRIGSDVALFVYGGTVRMTGRGDNVRLLGDSLRLYYVIVKPDCGVSTPLAYAQLDLRSSHDQDRIEDASEDVWATGKRERLLQLLRNDFQDVAKEACAEIVDIERSLYIAGAKKVLLAGSGSAVAGVFTDILERDSAFSLINKEYEKAWACESLDRNSTLIMECDD